MITEEKLQKFIDDLRVGKYDSEKYDVKNYQILDKKTGARIIFYLRKEVSKWVQTKFLKLWKVIKFDTPKYYIGINEEPDVEVSEELYNSFYSFFTELEEKDKLIERLNIKESFGLD